jgi:hypothetical protein
VRGNQKAADRTVFYYPNTAEGWIARAFDAAGKDGALAGFLIWQFVVLRLPHGVPRDGRRGFVRIPQKWARRRFGFGKGVFPATLRKLEAAGLIELHRPTLGSAYHVRVNPVGTDEERRMIRRTLGYER